MLGMWLLLIASLIEPISLPWNVLLHGIKVPFYVPVSPQLSTGTFQWDSWSSGQAGWLTHCCLVWCQSRSRQYGSNMTSRLQGCPMIALKTFSGSFWASSLMDIGSVFHHLKPSLPRYLMIIANQMSRLMLDACNARVIWPFHSSNASCWSSACQSNFGGWKISCPPAMILEID